MPDLMAPAGRPFRRRCCSPNLWLTVQSDGPDDELFIEPFILRQQKQTAVANDRLQRLLNGCC